MEKDKLIPEQVEMLKSELMKKINEHKISCEIKKEAITGQFAGTEQNGDTSDEIKSKPLIISNQLKKINNLLNDHELVVNCDTSVIGIGSYFTLTPNSKNATSNNFDCILIQRHLGIETTQCFVDLQSDIGKLVLGKKLGEKITVTAYDIKKNPYDVEYVVTGISVSPMVNEMMQSKTR